MDAFSYNADIKYCYIMGICPSIKKLKFEICLGSYLIIALDKGLLNYQQTINIRGFVLRLVKI